MTQKSKTIMIASIGLVIALAIIAIFSVKDLKDTGIITKPDSSESGKILKEFNKKFKSKDRQIIYYASSECGYCELQNPIIETLSEDYDMDYYYIDSSKLKNSHRKEILKKLEIEHATPTTVIVEKGKVIDTLIGYTPADEFIEFMVKNEMLPEDAVYSKEKNITVIDYEKYSEMIESEKQHIIVIGQTTCPHCIAFKDAMNSVAGDYDIKIYYLNLTDMSEEERTDFFESLRKIEYNDPDFVNKGSFGTPLTLIIKNGKVENYLSGERSTSQFAKELKKMGLIQE